MALEDQFDPIDEVFSRAHPNPDRVGCPSGEVLRALVLKNRPIDDPAYDHLATCSPCYRDFRRLQREGARPKVWWPATIAAVLLLAMLTGVVWWLTRRDGQAPVPKELAKVVQPGLGTTVLDLRPFRVSRSDQPKGEMPVLNLKRARQRVVIVLPTGAEPGQYEVQVLNEALASQISASSVATMKDYNVVIETEMDLMALPPGKYTLALRRAREDWRLYPVHLE